MAIVELAFVLATASSAASGLADSFQADRVLSFEAREGGWMSVDVSPDGTSIYFDLLGHLYVMPVTGGIARQLTDGPAFHQQPRISPCGDRLAFISDASGSDNLWVSDAHGAKPRQLSRLAGGLGYGNLSAPAWSPDCQRIVVSQRVAAAAERPPVSVAGTVWLPAIYDAESGALTWLPDRSATRQQSVAGAVFDQEGTAVLAAVDVFSSSPVFADRLTRFGTWRLARMRVREHTWELDPVALDSPDAFRPIISRSGRYQAYITTSGQHYGIKLHDRKTGAVSWLARDAIDEVKASPYPSQVAHYPSMAFLPSEEALLYWRQGRIRRVEISSGEESEIPFAAPVRRVIAANRVHPQPHPDSVSAAQLIMQPALSPRGDQLAFAAVGRIWIMGLDESARGRAPVPLNTDPSGQFYPAWAPDGDTVYFSAWRDREGGSLRRASAARALALRPDRSEALVENGFVYMQSVVSPAGTHLYAIRRPPSPEGIAEVFRPTQAPAFFERQRRLELVEISLLDRAVRQIRKLDELPRSMPLREADQVYFSYDARTVFIGQTRIRIDAPEDIESLFTVTGGEAWLGIDAVPNTVYSPDGRRALFLWKHSLFQLSVPDRTALSVTAGELTNLEGLPLASRPASTRRWGFVHEPWISWSADGSRVAFTQGNRFFLASAASQGWLEFHERAIEVPLERVQHEESILLRGARLITMSGEEVIREGDLLVTGNRIVKVTPAGRSAATPAVTVVDVHGKTIVPGFVDLHDHDNLPAGIHLQQSAARLARLAVGVTTTRNPSPGLPEIFGYADRERIGELIGPRIFSTGVVAFAVEPAVRSSRIAEELIRPHSEWFRTESFKLYFDYSAVTERTAHQYLAHAANAAGLNTTSHIDGLQLLVTSLIDGSSGLEHTMGGLLRTYDDVAQLQAQAHTFQTMTFGGFIHVGHGMLFRRYGPPWSYPAMRRFVPPSEWPLLRREATMFRYDPSPLNRALSEDLGKVLSAPRTLNARGAPVAVGAHGNASPMGFHYEMWAYAFGGLRNHEVLRAATANGAEALGHAGHFGKLKAGLLADLVILDGNPLEDIRHTIDVRYVMKDGRLFDAALTEVWPRCMPLDDLYLYDDSRNRVRTASCLARSKQVYPTR